MATLLSAVFVAVSYWRNARNYFSTDNVQIDGDTVDVNVPPATLVGWPATQPAAVHQSELAWRTKIFKLDGSTTFSLGQTEPQGGRRVR